MKDGTKSSPPSLDSLQRAIQLRAALFGAFRRENAVNAYRLLNAGGDDARGFLVDVYAGYLVVHVLDESALPGAGALEKSLAQALEPIGIIRKLRYQTTERGRVCDEVVLGREPPRPLQVLHGGMSLEVDLLDGFHTGLFTDMRDEHLRMRQLAAGRRVLNTFAYTGVFSVAAALGGAAQVTTVDVVAKVLDRAKRNFQCSGLDPASHHFARMEVLEYLALAKRRQWEFDAVVLDPPTFATFKGGRWSAKTDYPHLLDAAVKVVAPGGLLWAAANTESTPADRLERQIAAALRTARRSAKLLAVGGLPVDYPTPADEPQARYLKVYVLSL